MFSSKPNKVEWRYDTRGWACIDIPGSGCRSWEWWEELGYKWSSSRKNKQGRYLEIMHKSAFYSWKVIREAARSCRFRQWRAQCVPASLRLVLSSSFQGLKAVALSIHGCACSNYCNYVGPVLAHSNLYLFLLPDISCRPEQCLLWSKKPDICKLG